MSMHFHAHVATVDDDDAVEIMEDLPSYSCRSTEAMMWDELYQVEGDFAIGWLSDAGDASNPTDEDCWRPRRILDSLDHIEADCNAHPDKYPKGFLERHRDLIEGMRRVAEAAQENDALVLTVVG